MIETPEEREVFSAMEQSSVRKEIIRTTAQPAPQGEPVAKVVLTETLGLPWLQWLDLNRQFDFKGGEYLYTTPQQRTWVGLTDEEIKELDLSNYVQAVRIVETKLKEKNNGQCNL